MFTTHARPPKNAARRVFDSNTKVRTLPWLKTSLLPFDAFAARISFGRLNSMASSRTGTLGALAFFIVAT